MNLTTWYIDPHGQRWRITSHGTFWPIYPPKEHVCTYALGNGARCVTCEAPWPCDAASGVSS